MAIITTNGIQWKDTGTAGSAGKYTLPIEYVEVINTIMDNSTFNVLGALNDSGETRAKGGTATYYINSRPLVNDYDATGGANVPTARSVQILTDKRVDIGLEIETFDKEQSEIALTGGATIADKLIQNWIEAITQQKSLYLSTAFLSGILKASGTINNIQVADPNVADQTSGTIVYDALYDGAAEINSTLTSELAGIPQEGVRILINKKTLKFLIKANIVPGSNLAFDALKDGEIVRIAGLNIQIANQIGKKIAAGQIHSKDAFDLSTADIIIYTTRTYAFPWNDALSFSGTILPRTQNIWNYTKFAINSNGGQSLYPNDKLIRAYKIIKKPASK